MAKEEKMDGLALESHPLKTVVMVETTESGESTQTYRVPTPISNTIDENNTSSKHTRTELVMSRGGDWNCRTCSHLNFQRDSCQRCGDPRSDMGGVSRLDFGGFGGSRTMSSFGFTTGSDVRPGDWYCTFGNCGAHNFGSRSTCFKCGTFKDQSTGSRVGGTAMFGADARWSGVSGDTWRSPWKSSDWICTRPGCNEHNFASRMECFRCNAPKDSTRTFV